MQKQTNSVRILNSVLGTEFIRCTPPLQRGQKSVRRTYSCLYTLHALKQIISMLASLRASGVGCLSKWVLFQSELVDSFGDFSGEEIPQSLAV